MTAVIAWGEAALIASAALMLVVLAVRAPVRGWFGPRIGYALWAIPALRLILPPLPSSFFTSALTDGAVAPMLVLFAGPRGAGASSHGLEPSFVGNAALVVWLVGAVAVFATYAARHFVFCRRLRAMGTGNLRVASIRVIATDVDGPLAFGVFQRFIAVPHAFASDYDAGERNLALAHERLHHARGDLIANWASIAVLAVHWWNPIAWLAIRAFREDQEFAVDAQVLAAKGPDALASYAHVLAKAAGIGALPACNLNARCNLKGRLMMLGQNRRTSPQLVIGGITLAVLGGTALTATATTSGVTSGRQVVTIGVKPDGSGSYALIVGKSVVAPGAPLPGGVTLPADFTGSGGCNLKPAAKPSAMVIKGFGKTRTYTVMCASAAPAPVRASLAEGLASLNTMRASVATQQASKVFPETERTHALGAIDRSIGEVKATLSTLG